MAQPAAPPGASLPGPPPSAPPFPPYPPYYYPPPPPKSTNIVLIVVVVIVVVIAVSVILSALLYMMVSGLIGDGSGARPVVTFGPPTFPGGSAVLTVASVSERFPFGDFSATLLVNSTVGTAQPVTPSFTITVGGDPYPVVFTDLDGNGLLTSQDRFQITHAVGLPRGTTYQFELLWTDLSPVAFRSWTTP